MILKHCWVIAILCVFLLNYAVCGPLPDSAGHVPQPKGLAYVAGVAPKCSHFPVVGITHDSCSVVIPTTGKCFGFPLSYTSKCTCSVLNQRLSSGIPYGSISGQLSLYFGDYEPIILTNKIPQGELQLL